MEELTAELLGATIVEGATHAVADKIPKKKFFKWIGIIIIIIVICLIIYFIKK